MLVSCSLLGENATSGTTMIGSSLTYCDIFNKATENHIVRSELDWLTFSKFAKPVEARFALVVNRFQCESL